MNRIEAILRHLNQKGHGLEIGPAHSPVAPKAEGFQVDVIDYMDQPSLIQHYQSLGMETKNIEPVDYVWSGQPLDELTGKANYYDWIIASHVVEHVTDLVRFINDCDNLLKDDGVLSLAVPDKRSCFDFYRPISSLAQVIDSNYHQQMRHTLGSLIECHLYYVERDGKLSWSIGESGELTFNEKLFEPAKRLMQKYDTLERYRDCHGWCFTPSSFRLIMEDLHALGLIQLREVAFYPTAGHEFFVTLGRSGQGCGMSRVQLMEQIEVEQMEPKLKSTPLARLRDSVVRKISRLKQKVLGS